MTLPLLLLPYPFPIDNSLITKRHTNILIQMPMMPNPLILIIDPKRPPDNITPIDTHPLPEVSVEGMNGLLVDTRLPYFKLDVWQNILSHQRYYIIILLRCKQQYSKYIIPSFFYRQAQSHMESSQLKHIQNIENSLSLLKFKIDKMSQLDSHKQETINSLILNTVPIVDKKLKEEAKQQELQQKKHKYVNTTCLRKKNQESRLINEKEVSRSKELVSIMKQHNSMHLKKSREQNQTKIKKLKELNLEGKKERKFRIREQEQEAHKKIQMFHQQKTMDLRMKRQNQNKQNQMKIDHLMHQLCFLQKKEREVENKLMTSDTHLNKVRTAIKKVDKMKCTQFSRFKDQFTTLDSAKKSNSRCLSEAILLDGASK